MSTIACGACPDGSEPNEDCTCNDEQKTQLTESECTPKGDEGAGTGGTSNAGGSGGTGAAGGGAASHVVYDDEPEPEPGWVRDSSNGFRDGETAVHPPDLEPGDEASMTFDCGGEAHTQLSFYAWRRSSYGAAELALSDGNSLRAIVPAIVDGWSQYVFDVEPGTHDYTLTATSTSTTRAPAPFVVDSFVCRDVPREPGENMYVDFDDGFVPPEVAGDWLVDNINGRHEGEAAIHPPALEPGEEWSMTFDCAGEEHTQVSFFARRTSSYGVADLELFDGDVSRGLVPAIVDGWLPFILNVEGGSHRYTLTARSTSTTRVEVPFGVDTFVCKNVAPEAGLNGFVDFDDDFIPPEITGDWFVDNLDGKHEGEAAVHPPYLEPGEESSMRVDCGSDATVVRFHTWRTSSYDTGTLELFDGDEPRGMVPAIVDGWGEHTFEIESPRSLTFLVTNNSTQRLAPAFAIDTFVCE